MRRVLPVIGALAGVFAVSAHADYETHPDLRPEVRCQAVPPTVVLSNGVRALAWPDGRFTDAHGTVLDATGLTVASTVDAGGKDSVHCQRLFWDLPASAETGLRAVAESFAADPIPRFPNGLVDRPPSLYRFDPDGDGAANDCADTTLLAPDAQAYYAANATLLGCGDGTPDGFETIPAGFTAAELGRVAVCDRDFEIPFWKEILHDHDGDPETRSQPLEGIDPRTGATGPLFEVACRRGSRVTYGPWQIGSDPAAYDAIGYGLVRFESTERIEADVAELEPGQNPSDLTEGRYWDWNTGTEIYNHFSSHHGTCWQPTQGRAAECNNPLDPDYARRDQDGDGQPDDDCRDGYQEYADDGAVCDTKDGTATCPGSIYRDFNQMFRNATQLPGRIYVELPDGRAAPHLEDQLWACDHHVVHQLPQGSYGLDSVANYRFQKHGIRHPETGEWIGGAIGEMIFQAFAAPAISDFRPLSVGFDVIADAVTTWYPPFTWNVHKTVWYAPYDLAIGLMTTHAHHRNVRSYLDVVPANPVRLESPSPECGGGLGAEHVYSNELWEDARLCEYWKEPDGPVILRKGQGLVTTCYVNNGVTPEAIKHGLVAGAAVQTMRQQGAPIPPDPSTVPTSEWSALLVNSPVGQELLYGPHPPENFRVKYSCGFGPGFSFDVPNNNGGSICAPNPAVDADGDYIDAPYQNQEQCGGGWCNPSTVVFANVGEDEMCISVVMYWPLDALVDENGELDEEAMANLTSGNVNEVGTPGALIKSPSDLGYCYGCADDPYGSNPILDLVQ